MSISNYLKPDKKREQFVKEEYIPSQKNAPTEYTPSTTPSGISSYLAPQSAQQDKITFQKNKLARGIADGTYKYSIPEYKTPSISDYLTPSGPQTNTNISNDAPVPAAPNPYGENKVNNSYTSQDMFKNIKQMNDEAAGAYAKGVNASTEASVQRMNSQKHYINQQYDENVKAAGRNMDASLAKLPENMAGLGLYGQGVGETAIANIRNNYANQITELMKQRDNSIYDIDTQVENLRKQAAADIYNYNAKLLAQNPENYLETLRMENDNFWKGKDFGLREGELELTKGELLGVIDGQDTLANKQYQTNTRLEEIGLFGYDENGNPTLEAKKWNDKMVYDWASLESQEMQFWEKIKQEDAHFQAEMVLEWANHTQASYQFEASRSDNKQIQASAEVWNLVTMGQTPSDELLTAAGLLGEKTAIAGAANLASTQIAYGISGGSGGGSSGGGRSYSSGKRSGGGSGGSSGSGANVTATSARRIANLINESVGNGTIAETTTGHFDLGNVSPWQVAGYIATYDGLTDEERYAYTSAIVGGDEAADEAIEYAKRCLGEFPDRSKK